MPQKLTLTVYLMRRGTIKALTKIEAETFGIPYPLQSGWPSRYAGMEITKAMLEELAVRIASAKESTARKAQGGLNAATRMASDSVPVSSGKSALAKLPTSPGDATLSQPATKASFPGFVLRQARRFRARSVAPGHKKARSKQA